MALVVNGYCYSDHTIAIAVFNSMHDRYFPISQYAYGQIRAIDIDGKLSVQVSNINGSYQQFFPTGNTLPVCTTPGALNAQTFDPSTMNPVDVANAVGHGFLFVAVPLLVVWGGRLFLKQLFSRS